MEKARERESVLNQAIISGTVTGKPVFDDKDSSCTFKIKSCSRSEDGAITWIRTCIRTYGNIAEVCHAHLKAGRAVRVAGRFEVKGSRLFITAEHVEFLPRVRG